MIGKYRSEVNNSLSSDTESIDEKTPSVTDNPSVESDSPNRGEEDGTDKHDCCILTETEFTSDPISLVTDSHLTENDTDDFEVILSGDPVLVTDGVGSEALGPCRLEECRQVTDREENVT